MKITPHLWFGNNDCEEALRYYCEVFPNSKILEIQRYPEESLDEHFKGMSGKVLTAVFELDGQRFMGIDGGPYYFFNEAISMVVECEDQGEINYYWEKLSHSPDDEQCGWCKDKFGLSWQIVPANMKELTKAPGQIKAMMKMKKIEIDVLKRAAE